MSLSQSEYKMFFDGACRGNPGQGSYGGIILKDDTELVTFNKVINGKTTNNIAEYSGVYNGLLLASHYGIKELNVYGDSQLVIKQLNGEFKVKNEKLREIWNECKKLEKGFSSITYNYVPRNQNKIADGLANLALDS